MTANSPDRVTVVHWAEDGTTVACVVQPGKTFQFKTQRGWKSVLHEGLSQDFPGAEIVFVPNP